MQVAGRATLAAAPTPVAPTVTPPATASAAADAGARIRAAFASVVRMRTPRGEGDGPQVIAPDGDAWPATLPARDPLVGLVVLGVTGPTLPALPLADDRPAVGDPLTVVGFPLGGQLRGDPTVTRGVVSGRRQVEDVEYLQTDAAMNSGNNGGPVLTQAGAVAGVATWGIRTDRGVAIEGIGSAIPAARVRALLARPAEPAPADAPPMPSPKPLPVQQAPIRTGEWTVILASLPVADGKTRQDAEQEAARARARGYRAGVLLSDDYGSLRAGNWVMYSGAFGAEAEARPHADRIRAAGYSTAYPRRLARI